MELNVKLLKVKMSSEFSWDKMFEKVDQTSV
jgi:hypothetical protein